MAQSHLKTKHQYVHSYNRQVVASFLMHHQTINLTLSLQNEYDDNLESMKANNVANERLNLQTADRQDELAKVR